MPAPLCVHKIKAVRERGIVHRVWRCLARLRIGTRKTVGDLRWSHPRIDNIAAAAVARDGQRQDDIGIGIRGNRVVRYAQCFEFVNARSVVASVGWCRSTGRIGNRIRGVVARLAVRACETVFIRNGQIFRVRDGRAAAVARDGQRER